MRVTLRALALAMAVLAGWQARAAEPDALPPAVYTHVATPARQVAAAAMLRLAAQAGQARVIIGLALTLGSPATLNEAQESAQTTRLRGLQRAMLQRTLGRSTGDDLRLYRVIPFVAATVTAAQLARLFADPDVRTVELDRQSQPAALGYDMTLIEADEVWARGFRGAGYTVVVLDTGVQLTHPVFAGKIVAQGCFSSNFAGYSSLCPGGAASSLAPGSGAACAASVCNHGTYVASIAVGNGAGFEGVAPAASLIPVQMNSFSASVATCYPRPAPCVTSYMSDQVSALEQVQTWSKSFKIAAVNMSTGAGSYPAACDSIFPAQAAIVTALRSQGVLTAIASGNDSLNGSIAAPACLSSAVAVGSTDAADSVSSFSNQSSLVKLMAPGSNITGAIPGGGFTVGSGTSLAAPHVAGAIALLRRAAPSWASPEDVLSALACASQPVTRANLTKPRIDVLWADNYLNYLPPGTWNWTFSKPAAVAAWTPLVGTWVAQGGGYGVASFPPGDWAASWFPNCQAGVSVTATMTRVDADPQFQWNSGVMLMSGVNPRADQVSGYWFAYNKSMNASNAVVWRLDNFDLRTNTGGATSLCAQHVSLAGGNGPVTLTVVSQGGATTFSLNGTATLPIAVCSFNDATYSTGQVLLMAAGGGAKSGRQSLTVQSISIAPPSAAGLRMRADLAAAPPLYTLGPAVLADATRGISPLGVTH